VASLRDIREVVGTAWSPLGAEIIDEYPRFLPQKSTRLPSFFKKLPSLLVDPDLHELSDSSPPDHGLALLEEWETPPGHSHMTARADRGMRERNDAK
jgi:hypothetical protein